MKSTNQQTADLPPSNGNAINAQPVVGQQANGRLSAGQHNTTQHTLVHHNTGQQTDGPRIDAESGSVDRDDLSVLRAIFRLGLGGALFAVAGLSNRLAEKDKRIFTPTPEELTQEQEETLFYLILGLMVDARLRVQRQTLGLRNMAAAVAEWAIWGAQPIIRFPLLQPIRRQIETTVSQEWTRLILLGQTEAAISRKLTGDLSQDLVDEVLTFLSTKPEVRDLVQAQSVGLATEVVGGVRRRTVTADNWIEAWVGKLLKRQKNAERTVSDMDTGVSQNGADRPG